MLGPVGHHRAAAPYSSYIDKCPFIFAMSLSHHPVPENMIWITQTVASDTYDDANDLLIEAQNVTTMLGPVGHHRAAPYSSYIDKCPFIFAMSLSHHPVLKNMIWIAQTVASDTYDDADDLLCDCLLYTSDAADDLTRVDLGG